jgi:signal transduction histidine kinase/ActR/RegA family two-component response regulator
VRHSGLGPLAQWIARIRAPLSAKLLGAFLLFVTVLLATGIASLLTIARIESQVTELRRLDEAVTLARGLDYSIVAQEHLSSMFVLTAEEPYHVKLQAERDRFRATAARLAKHGMPAEVEASIASTFTRYVEASEEVVRAKNRGLNEFAQHVHVDREHVIAHEIEGLTRSQVARFQNEQQEAVIGILREQRRITWAVAGFFLFAIVLAVGLGTLLARSIVDPIQRVDATLQRIAGGEFGAVAQVASRDELGSLGAHVNGMSHQLAQFYARERQTARELQVQYETLQRTQAQLIQVERLRALGEMAGGVAHDFNNLLTVVLGQADFVAAKLARGAVSPAELEQRIGIIRTAALDGAETVRRLLEFTRAAPRAGRAQPTDASALFASVVAAAEPRWKDEANARGRMIEVVTDFGEVPPVLAYPAELREVLLNIVFNALDAMGEGGRLALVCRADTESAYLSVSDTGPGISENLLPRIFEPFFTTKGPQRTGLGLSVSYGIVRRHQGDLTVESQPGKGTVFTVRLPLAPQGSPAGEEAASAPPEARCLRVLVVDDEDLVRATLRDICADEGHHVLEARSGREALELLAARPIDVVYTDLGMPGMTGWQLADQIRDRWPYVRVVLITGWGASVQPEELQAHHVDFLIAKPFRRDQVLAVLVPAEKPPAR